MMTLNTPLSDLYPKCRKSRVGSPDDFAWVLSELDVWLGHRPTLADLLRINVYGLSFFDWIQGRRRGGHLTTCKDHDYVVTVAVELLRIGKRECRRAARKIEPESLYTVAIAAAGVIDE
jgi:hypothetical protein